MKSAKKAFSKLTADEQAKWYDAALRAIYPGTEPAYPDHDRRMREKMRELYYAEPNN